MESETKNGLLISSAVLIILAVSFYTTKTILGTNPIENPIAWMMVYSIIIIVIILIMIKIDLLFINTTKPNKQQVRARE